MWNVCQSPQPKNADMGPQLVIKSDYHLMDGLLATLLNTGTEVNYSGFVNQSEIVD